MQLGKTTCQLWINIFATGVRFLLNKLPTWIVLLQNNALGIALGKAIRCAVHTCLVCLSACALHITHLTQPTTH